MRSWLGRVEVLKDGLSTRLTFPEIQLEQISIAEISDRKKH